MDEPEKDEKDEGVIDEKLIIDSHLLEEVEEDEEATDDLEDDPLLPRRKKVVEDAEGDSDTESLDDLAAKEAEEDAEDGYDDVDLL